MSASGTTAVDVHGPRAAPRVVVRRILIVDHDREIIRVLSEFVAMCGYEAHKVEDSRQVIPGAVELKPAAILLDMCMPGKSGVELLGELRKEAPESPVIMISGQEDIALIRKVFRLGAREYLVKPFEFAQLKRSLEETIAQEAKVRPLEENRTSEHAEESRNFASVAEYLGAYRDSEHGQLAFVPISFAAEYLGMTPTGVTQLARRGEMREIVVNGPSKRWIGIGISSLIKRHEHAGEFVLHLAHRVRAELESLAAQRRTCRLLEVMVSVGMNPRVPQQRRIVHDALEVLSEESYRGEGFLLSALCSMTSLGVPSNNFFGLAVRLGALRAGMDHMGFYKDQIRKIFRRFRPAAAEESQGTRQDTRVKR
jgi:FixJ family two-component response regulator